MGRRGSDWAHTWDYLGKMKRNSIRYVKLRKGTKNLLQNKSITHSSNWDDNITTEQFLEELKWQ